ISEDPIPPHPINVVPKSLPLGLTESEDDHEVFPAALVAWDQCRYVSADMRLSALRTILPSPLRDHRGRPARCLSADQLRADRAQQDTPDRTYRLQTGSADDLLRDHRGHPAHRLSSDQLHVGRGQR